MIHFPKMKNFQFWEVVSVTLKYPILHKIKDAITIDSVLILLDVVKNTNSMFLFVRNKVTVES